MALIQTKKDFLKLKGNKVEISIINDEQRVIERLSENTISGILEFGYGYVGKVKDLSDDCRFLILQDVMKLKSIKGDFIYPNFIKKFFITKKEIKIKIENIDMIEVIEKCHTK